MLMMAEPIGEHGVVTIWNPILPVNLKWRTKTLFLSPRGQFNHRYAIELLDMEQIILICGHYEGVDERVIEKQVPRKFLSVILSIIELGP